MEDWDFIELDSYKGEKLLDTVAFQRWQRERYVDPDEAEAQEGEREQAYDEMRVEVRERYTKLKADMANLTVLQARRVFQYLQGESLRDIAQSEAPQVDHMQIDRTLKRICGKWGWSGEQLNQARLVWQYGRLYFE